MLFMAGFTEGDTGDVVVHMVRDNLFCDLFFVGKVFMVIVLKSILVFMQYLRHGYIVMVNM